MALALSLPSFVDPAENLLKENEHLLKGNLPGQVSLTIGRSWLPLSVLLNFEVPPEDEVALSNALPRIKAEVDEVLEQGGFFRFIRTSLRTKL